MRKAATIVLLDTSIIIHALDRNVDLISSIYEAVVGPVDICVPRAVLDELHRLAVSGSASKRRKARVALSYIESRKERLKIIETPRGPVDKVVLETAEMLGATIATSDTELRREAVKRGLRVLFLWDSRKKVFGEL